MKLTPDLQPDPLLHADKFVSQPYPRVDGRLKVTGSARYSAEFPVDGLTYAALVHSPIAKGKITALDTAAAEAVPGVLAVMTYLNAPRLQTPSYAYVVSMANPLAGSTTTLPIMQSAAITWNGQPVAVVVAETLALAQYAASLVHVRYEVETPRLTLAHHQDQAFKPDHVVLLPADVTKGDAEAALPLAPVRVDNLYTTPYLNHNAMEPHATTAKWDAAGRLTVYDSTQYPVGVQEALMEVFDLKTSEVRVITEFVGGAFGGKVAMWQNTPLAAAAARLVGRPVQLSLARASVNYLVGGRTTTEQRVALGATADGQLTAVIHSGYSMCTPDVYAEQFSVMARHQYAAPNIHSFQRVVELDRVQNSFMRAPGETPGSFALESAMDELAYALKMDPLALRRRNEPVRDPTEDTPFSSRHLLECYDQGARFFGWDPARPAPGTTQRGEWLVGTGVAGCYYPVQPLPATVRARLTPAGDVTVFTSSVEMGVGAATIQTQHIAERFGVAFERAHYVQGDTDLPQWRAMGGSAATASVGAAIRAAADKLTDELFKLAQADKDSPLHKAERGAVALRTGGLYLTSDPTTGVAYADLLAGQDKPFFEVEGSSPPPTEGAKYSMSSYGVHFCEVGVHADTREVRVRRFVTVMDCGRIVNPKTARSQIQGGIVMGLGMALMEESAYDERTGRLMNPDLGEYHVPVQADLPALDVHFLNLPDPHMTLGVKPVGEIGIVGSAAALANAVYHATGIRVRDLPITADKLL
ncbi:xanthine dehydrogenase family protein molybdopterin-binding subunit [Hymenobacter sp. RP-2-7]|uniref:Xanthine dehydrogenase family protein molybdopterin-binding subunit n=2 Tax=Hymenobacter polaris TaxID=2682546 RepID=A0A7Y0AIG7_9BACT|nr:xanthine dehydrogenase family protein molybdopterin-binding subunit [Hymenobacter polaris]